MKISLDSLKRRIAGNAECVWYIVTNLVAVAIALILRFIPLFNPLFDAINVDETISNTIVTIVVTIVTLVAALESLVTQIYFNRSTKRYFSKTSKSITSIIIFGAIGLVFAFKISVFATEALLLILLLTVIIFVVFFIIDLVTIDVPHFIRKQINAIVKDIEKGVDKNIKQTESRLAFVFKDSLLNDDQYFVEQVIRNAPRIVDEILKNKYKNDSTVDEKSPLRESLEYVFILFKLCLEFCNDSSREYFSKRLMIACSDILKMLLDYNNPSLIENAIERTTLIINDSNKPYDIADFFSSFMLNDGSKDKHKPSLISKIKVCYKIYNPIFVNFKLEETDDFLARLTSLFENKHIDSLDDESYKLFKTIISKYMSKERPNEYVMTYYLFYLWRLAYKTDYLDDFKKFIGFKNKESDFRLNSKNCFAVDVLLHKIAKEVSLEELADYYIISLENVSISLYYFKEEQYLKPLPFKEEMLNKCLDLYIETFAEVSKHGNPNVVRGFFETLNDFGASLPKNNKKEQTAILRIYSETLVSLAKVESSDRIVDIEIYYLKFIHLLDDKKTISEALEGEIIDNFISTVHTLVSLQSPHAYLIYEDFDVFGAFKCDLDFINSKKASKYVDLCIKAKTIGILGREYQNKEIIKTSSGFIGWSIYRLLIDKVDSYNQAFSLAAIPLFKTLIELKSDNDIIDFVGTLFVINFAYCLSLNKNDQRYKSVALQLTKFNKEQLERIKKSILLRKSEKKWLNMTEEEFNRGITALEKELTSRIKSFNG